MAVAKMHTDARNTQPEDSSQNRLHTEVAEALMQIQPLGNRNLYEHR